MRPSSIKSSWPLALAFAFILACTKPPTLLQRSPIRSIPDGLTVILFTAKPLTAFQFRDGQLVPCPFIPSGRASKGQAVPLGIQPKRRVEDWIKIPSTNQVAVLTTTERWGLWPPDLLAMLAGHPIPHNTFYIELYDSSGHFQAEVKCLTGTNLSASIQWQPPASA